MVQIHCASCGLDRAESVGVGMLGKGTTLCACYRCRRFVRKHWEYEEPNEFQCSRCKRPLTPVEWKGYADEDEREAQYGECPVCGGQLTGVVVGNWD